VAADPRVVVVTGAGGAGCGRSISARFAAHGAAVVVSDIDEVGARETVRTIEAAGGRAAECLADVRDEASVRELVSFAERTFGGLHVLVNNASATHVTGDTIGGWTEPLETDLLGAIRCTRWAIDAMRRAGGGAIVNIASISALWHGRRTAGGFAGYDVAKAGMIRMTTRLAELATSDNIRVNCLAPGWIATGGALAYWESLTAAERETRGVPSRLIAPAEIAAAVERLASDRSLAGRIVVWWSEDQPQLVEWADRGYRRVEPFALT